MIRNIMPSTKTGCSSVTGQNFYREAEEVMTGNMPVARGNFMLTHCFVDMNHFGNTETGSSKNSILLFYNSVPIIWLRKRQNSVEASKFRSEFTLINIVVEMI